MASVLSANSLLSKYLSFFQYRGESLVRRSGSCWRKVSRFHSLTDQEIADSLQVSSKLCRAFCLDSKSQFLIIHIPASGNCRSPKSIKQVLASLRQIGISAGTYQIEEDWYLYIFFRQQVKLNKYADLLSEFLASAGFELRQESFSVLRQGAHAPLPLQPGFSWIDSEGRTLQFPSTLTSQDTLQRWLSEAEALAVDPDSFEFLCLDSSKIKVVQSIEDRSGQTGQTVQSKIAAASITALTYEPPSDSGSELNLSTQLATCPDSSSQRTVEPELLSAELESSQVFPPIEQLVQVVQSDQIESLVAQDNEIQFEDFPEQLPLFPEFPVPTLPVSRQEPVQPQPEIETSNKLRTADAFPQLSLFRDSIPVAHHLEQPLQLPKTIPKRLDKVGRAPPDTGQHRC